MMGKIYRDLGLEDTVTVELDVYGIIQAVAEYANAPWAGPATSKVLNAMYMEILNPLYVKEQQAAAQEQSDIAQGLVGRFLTGQGPEVPPNVEDV